MPSPSAPRLTTGLLVAGSLVLAGALVLAFVAFLFGGSRLAAARQQALLYDELQSNLALTTVPVSGVIAPGTPVGVVDIPAIDLEQVIVEGSTSDQTRIGPGHKPDTVLPGQTGLSVLVGRRAAFAASFAHLADLHTGDAITVTTGQGRFVYSIDLIRTSDAPATEILSVPSRLTLVTSDPALTPSRTLTVSARLIGDPQPASTGIQATADNQPGEGTLSRSVSLLLWAQLLLVVAVAVTWAAIRHQARATWIGGVPLLLAILWNVFENLAVLLPNTL